MQLPLLSQRPDLDALLEKEYNEETVSKECKSGILDYIENSGSISSKDIIFIKRLTKISHRLLSLDPECLEGMIIRLQLYCIEGIEKIDKEEIEGLQAEELMIMKSHLFAYAGDFSKALFDETQEIFHLLNYFNCYENSAELSMNVEPEHAGHAYAFKGEAAKLIQQEISKSNKSSKLIPPLSELSQESLEVYWLKEWSNSKKRSGEILRDLNPKVSSHSFGSAGTANKILYKKIGDITYAKDAIKCYNYLLEYYENKTINERIKKLLFGIKRDIKSLKNKVEAYESLYSQKL